ncbi:putative HVA22-like protein g [Hibiscus syriacus]|uniref:HVA22-like protein g n=1 Tax=Hibiscus syriacus TaxID=106335 RepID=A0A6A2XRW9_HIBSY|nr:putative HVA22-like protein g [Hibiscus syriacus]
MLGDFLTRLLVLVFGYAYPAFECFKKVEKSRVEIDELRFWCKYWILVAFITVLERITDIHFLKSKDRSLNNIPPSPSPNGLRSPSARAFNSALNRVNFVDSLRHGQPDSPSAYQFDNDDDSILYSPSNSWIQHARLKLRRTKPEN